MQWITRAKALWRLFFQRQRVEDELDDEVQAYFELLTDRYREQGLSSDEARRAARVKFEKPEQVKEKVREARTGALLDALLKDVCYAFRMIRRNPGFSAAAACSLAIGIGATSAMYSVTDGLLLRPLPVPNAGAVVALSPVTDQLSAGLNTFSYPEFTDFRDRNRTFQGLVAQGYNPFGFAADHAAMPRMKYGMFVSGNFFQLLGVEPALGRVFRSDEDRIPGRDPVVVLSHDLWVSDFGSRSSAVGQTVWLNGIAVTIVGVTPENFTGTDQFLRPALYVPFAMAARLRGTNTLDQRQVRWLALKGRLRPGVRMEQASADIDAITASLRKMYPDVDGALKVKVESDFQYQTEFSPQRTAFLVMLSLLAICVLLAACANVAGLLLSRSTARSREIAMRLAIGAGRIPLVRQLLIENSLLAICGGGAGLWLAYGAVRLWKGLPLGTDLPFQFNIQVDHRVLLFTAVVSILSTLLFGLAPALRATRLDLAPALRTKGGEEWKKRVRWGRNLLVCGQVAISLVLLMVAAVLAAGFRADLLRGPGFRTSGLFLASFNTSILRYGDVQRDAFYKQLLDRMRLAEGVRSAALTSAAPMSVGGATLGIVPEGYVLKRGQEVISVFHSLVSDGYFETLGIPILRGRGFRDSDRADTPAVAVVNEHLAQHFWLGQDALGKTLRLNNGAGTLVEIVGIARNAKYVSIIEAPTDFLYLPFAQNRQAQMTLVGESQSDDPAVLAPVFRRVVQDLDRNMPVFDARSMRDLYENRAIKSPNLLSETVGSLAAMGLVLAIVGLYGLVAFSVSRRTREFGIRMAVGADCGGITRLVLKQALTLAAVGVTAGFGIGIAVSRAITSQVFVNGVTMGVLPPVGVAVLLILTTTTAAWLPARRAGRIDPMQALRDE